MKNKHHREAGEPETCLSVATGLLGELLAHKPEGGEVGLVEKVAVELADWVNIAETRRCVGDREWIDLLDPFLALLPAGNYKAYYMVKTAQNKMSVLYATAVYSRVVGENKKGTAE